MDKEEKFKVLEELIVAANDALCMMEEARIEAMTKTNTPRQDDIILTFHDQMKEVMMSACGLVASRVSKAMGLSDEEFEQAVTAVCDKHGVKDE